MLVMLQNPASSKPSATDGGCSRGDDTHCNGIHGTGFSCGLLALKGQKCHPGEGPNQLYIVSWIYSCITTYFGEAKTVYICCRNKSPVDESAAYISQLLC